MTHIPLTGEVPSQLAHMPNLFQVLNVSSTQLQGTIPPIARDLKALDLSHNGLTGSFVVEHWRTLAFALVVVVVDRHWPSFQLGNMNMSSVQCLPFIAGCRRSFTLH